MPEAAVVAWIQAAIQLCSAVQLCLPRSGIYKGDNIPLESSSCSSVNSYISCVQLDAECLLRLCPCNTARVGGRNLRESKLSTRGRKQCIYGGTAKLFLHLFLSILWGPAPKPPVLTSFEGNVILTVYF